MVASAFDDRYGVFHVPADDEGVRRRALDHGWHVIALDTTSVIDKNGFMAVSAEVFDLPTSLVTDWTGLDAGLRALDRDEPDGLLVIWDHWDAFAVADPEGFEYAVEVFQDACVAWRDDDFQGAVLLRGPGPETDLPAW